MKHERKVQTCGKDGLFQESSGTVRNAAGRSSAAFVPPNEELNASLAVQALRSNLYSASGAKATYWQYDVCTTVKCKKRSLYSCSGPVWYI